MFGLCVYSILVNMGGGGVSGGCVFISKCVVCALVNVAMCVKVNVCVYL